MSDYQDIKVAVVGGGYWGKNLVRNFAELGNLRQVCDSSASVRENLMNKYPGVTTTDNYSQVLESPDINAVVIATPAALHYEMTKLALEAGKDVLVEKPLALEVREGKELAARAAEKKKVLMVGHILEYHPAVKKLVELVRTGHLGKIHYIYSNRLNLGKFRTEENILWSFAPHDISVILRLLNEVPHSVSANGGEYLSKGIADVTITNLLFNSGVKAHIFVSWLHPFKEQKLVVVGSEKMAVFDDVAENKLLLYPHKVNWLGRQPVAEKAEAEVIDLPDSEPLREECKHFLQCVAERTEPLTGSDNAINVLSVLSASQESLVSGGKKVPIASKKEADKGYYVHPTSFIEKDVTIGKGSKVWHFSHIMPGARLGEKCNVGQNVFIAGNTRIGNNVKIQNNVSIYEGVILEDDVFCGPSCVFTNIKTPRSAYPRNTADDYTETLVKKGASIGANATVVCGVTIGEHALIGAGAVVTKNVPDHAVVYGNPAEVKGWACKCGSAMVSNKHEPIQCKICSDI